MSDYTPRELITKRFDAYTVACNSCGDVLEGEFGPLWFTPEMLAHLGDHLFDDENWHVDIYHVDPGMGGNALACAKCWQHGWCDACGNEIHAWQQNDVTTGIEGLVHKACEVSS